MLDEAYVPYVGILVPYLYLSFHFYPPPNSDIRSMGRAVHQGRVRSEHDLQHEWLRGSTAYPILRGLGDRGSERNTQGRKLGVRQAENFEWFMPDAWQGVYGLIFHVHLRDGPDKHASRLGMILFVIPFFSVYIRKFRSYYIVYTTGSAAT
jgi:hypothetical protein